MHPVLIVQLLALLCLANGAPLIAKKLFGTAFTTPVDRGITLADGKPLFGRSKTFRGIAFAFAMTTFGAPIAGVSRLMGLVVSAAAMSGDLLSSFLKRRLGLVPGSMALGVDQIPESLLPAIAARWFLPLTILDIAFVTVLFLAFELLASRVLFALNIRDRPY
ncbi:MAG: CDP-archaeol synthase [Methylocapsa sp.]|nr:CDP-archaeol synthase [Methylocapsa sp.]